MSTRARSLAREQARRGSARVTQEIAHHYGSSLGMLVSCGYPKSGTVWLTRLISEYTGLPYAEGSLLPLALPCVIHAHWQKRPNTPPAGYIYRDGRDVIVSKYFHNMRVISEGRNPRAAAKLKRRYQRIYGLRFDPVNVRANLPLFIESEMQSPTSVKSTWQEHVHQWVLSRPPNVFSVRYEDLLKTPQVALVPVMEGLTRTNIDKERLTRAIEKHDFSRASGRAAGDEDRSSILRKGTAGDWRNYFTEDAEQCFDAYAGSTLDALGYDK